MSPKETHPKRYSARDVEFPLMRYWPREVGWFHCLPDMFVFCEVSEGCRFSAQKFLAYLSKMTEESRKMSMHLGCFGKRTHTCFFVFFQQQVDCFAGCFGMTGESAIRLCQSMELSLSKPSKVIKAMQAETNQQNQHWIVEFESTSCIQKVPW